MLHEFVTLRFVLIKNLAFGVKVSTSFLCNVGAENWNSGFLREERKNDEVTYVIFP